MCSAVNSISFRLNYFTDLIVLSRLQIIFGEAMQRSRHKVTLFEVSEFKRLMILSMDCFFRAMERSVSLRHFNLVLSFIVIS